MSNLSPEQELKRKGAIRLEISNSDTVKPPPDKVKFERVSLQTIMGMSFSPLKWAIEGYVAEGFSVLAGRQKLGKTWMALDYAIAVAIGGTALGEIPTKQGNVLYLDLENGYRRIKSRIELIFPNERTRPDLSAIEIVTDSPDLDKNFLTELDGWRLSVENPRLVIIDVLQRIKPAGSGNRNAYENDYSIYQDLQSWATNKGVAVLGLHHTRKGGADDPLEALSGSNGLSACADTTLVLDRDQNGMSLYVRGRDVEEKQTAIKHDLGTWTILGEAAEVHRSEARKVILQCLANKFDDNLSKVIGEEGSDNFGDNFEQSMSPAEVADVTAMRVQNVNQLLFKMANDGEVRKFKRGRYIHVNFNKSYQSPLTPDNNDKVDNVDNFGGGWHAK